MKLSVQVFAFLVAALTPLSQPAIATPSSRVMSQNAILQRRGFANDSYQSIGKKLSIPGKIELQPLSLIAQQSNICKPGTILVRINAPDNTTPAYSGKLHPSVNSGTRCIFFKDVSFSSGEKQQIADPQSAKPQAKTIVELSSDCQSAISQIRYSLPSSIVHSVSLSPIENFGSGQPKKRRQYVMVNIQGFKGYNFMLSHTNTNLPQISEKVIKSCPEIGIVSFFLMNSRMERSYGLVKNKVLYFPCVDRREANEWGKNMCL